MDWVVDLLTVPVMDWVVDLLTVPGMDWVVGSLAIPVMDWVANLTLCGGLGNALADCSRDGVHGGLVGYSCDGSGGKLDSLCGGLVDWVMHMLTIPVMECMVGLLTIPSMDWVVDVLING